MSRRREDWHKPCREQSTRFLSQSTRGTRTHLAEMQFALKERRLQLERDLVLVIKAEAEVQANIQDAIRRRARLTRAVALRRINREI